MAGLSVPSSWGNFGQDELGGFDDVWGVARSLGADATYVQPRLDATQTTYAVQSMQPITGSASDGGQWSDFWRGVGQTVQGLVQYAVVKDAAKSGITPTGQALAPAAGVAYPAGMLPAQAARPNLGAVLLIGGAVVALVLLAKD